MRTKIGGKRLWTDDDRYDLRQRAAAGKTAKDIGQEMGRSRVGVQKQARMLGLELTPQPYTPVGSNPWTDWRIETLKKLWKDNLSAEIIGKRINMSRNAVLGKIHRMGLSEERAPPPGPKKKPVPKDKVVRFKKHNIGFEQEMAADFQPPPPPRVDDIPRVSITDLDKKHRDCRWPCVSDPAKVMAEDLDAKIYCGLKAVTGLPYCKGHAFRAYAAPRPRRASTHYALAITTEAGRSLVPSSS